ncbi:hypothetical protein [Lolliginicoccus lacisalsi]|nr:hypothetical protein [Lolliginicoccus lacisalsi]
MDLIAWILDPVSYQQEISDAYWGAIYGAVNNYSNYLTQIGYPPR